MIDYKKISELLVGENFYFQGEVLQKTHPDYISNWYGDFPVNAIYLTGLHVGDLIHLTDNTEVITSVRRSE